MMGGILVGAFLQCVGWLLMSGALWFFQNGIIVQNTPQEVAHELELAGGMLGAGLLNVAALVAFANRGRGYALWLLAVVQAANLASSLVIVSLSPTLDDYFRAMSVAALTLLLLASFGWVLRDRPGQVGL